MDNKELPVFTQIAYIPRHADGNINHPDVEYGFTTSVRLKDGTYYCRYWDKKYLNELRTKSNGERTSEEFIVEFVSRPKQEVDDAIENWTIYIRN
jgi:recombinational DNA repair protein RecT